MKIIDCITYFDEPLLFEIRANTLSDYVDQFIVCEAKYTHAGKKKNLNFDINRYKKFKDKINYIVVDQQPDNLFDESKINKTNNQFYRLNAQRRIYLQREAIFEELSKNDKEDWIIYSDSDEIPNLEYFKFNTCKKKVVLFNQKLFYYKFNLTLLDNSWFGSKACKLKNLKSISALRNIRINPFDNLGIICVRAKIGCTAKIAGQILQHKFVFLMEDAIVISTRKDMRVTCWA